MPLFALPAPVDPPVVVAAPVREVQDPVVLAALFARPRLGLRLGAGTWASNGTIFVAGADLTFRVPFLTGIPALRADIEGWSEFPPFGSGSRGSAVSLLALGTLPTGLVYYGIGPSLWNTSNGSRANGLGAKLLIGTEVLRAVYIEGSTILGPSRAPFAVTVGVRF